MSQSVRLIALTKPVSEEFLSDPNTENFISYCARVSNPSNQENFDTAGKLLSYCMRNKHWSIFEMVHAVMEIETTRDIGRQILRHKSFSFQEFSQRYADPTTMGLGFSVREARLQDKKNRQNSIAAGVAPLIAIQWEAKQQQIIHEAKLAYKWAIENNIAKEQARVVLPEGLTNSRMYMAGSLRSWIHYCDGRREVGTQKEHREIADAAWNILCGQFKFLNSHTQNQ